MIYADAQVVGLIRPPRMTRRSSPSCARRYLFYPSATHPKNCPGTKVMAAACRAHLARIAPSCGHYGNSPAAHG